MARVSCTTCHGLGTHLVRNGQEAPCDCVFRAIFRACYRRFRECVALGAQTGSAQLELCGFDGNRVYARKKEEFVADFCLVSKRALDALEYKIFRYHYLLGADWKLCQRRANLDRGTFYHFIYRIESKLGQVFAELQPYPLFPLDEYFGGVIKREPQFAPLDEADPVDEEDLRFFAVSA